LKARHAWIVVNNAIIAVFYPRSTCYDKPIPEEHGSVLNRKLLRILSNIKTNRKRNHDMRVRVTFAKTETIRFTSHLDLHRAWERTFRRAGLSLAYTQGYRPHPRLNLASALPLGFTSQGELLDAWLEQTIPAPEIQEKLEQSLPPGLKILGVQEVDLNTPPLQIHLESSEYTITLLEPVPNLASRLEDAMKAEHLYRQWRKKDYDLRPMIIELSMLPVDNLGRQRFLTRLTAREGATGRPEEIVSNIGLSPSKVRIHRNRLIFQPELCEE
jgi:radical SAM-linked protein